jgi:hypothetical protein
MKFQSVSLSIDHIWRAFISPVSTVANAGMNSIQTKFHYVCQGENGKGASSETIIAEALRL